MRDYIVDIIVRYDAWDYELTAVRISAKTHKVIEEHRDDVTGLSTHKKTSFFRGDDSREKAVAYVMKKLGNHL